MSNLPISARDKIVFRPYDFALDLTRKAADKRVSEAEEIYSAALKAAPAELIAEDAVNDTCVVAARAALDKAKEAGAKAVADAETEVASRPAAPSYTLRIPLPRITAAVSRDVNAEAVPAPSNQDIIDALAESVDELGDEDAAFVTQVKAEFDDLGKTDPEKWDRVWIIAKRVPASATLIADRSYRWERERFHLIRHCVELPGQRSPLSESAAAAIPEEDRMFLAMKIAQLLRPSETEIKN